MQLTILKCINSDNDNDFIMPPPLIGGALSNAFVWSLSDVCLSVCMLHTSGLTREQRGLGRPELAQR